MKNPAGSYDFEAFSQQEPELMRLKRQATFTLNDEKNLWKHAGLTAGMKVLEIGCGSGIMSCQMAKEVNPGEVIGVDLSASMLSHARQVQKQEGVNNVVFQQENVYQLDFPDDSFDFVYSRLLFQHLTDPLQALTNIYRILKPGGIICVLDVDDDWFTIYPEPESFQVFCEHLANIRRKMGGDPQIGRKLNGYFCQAGFTNVQTQVTVTTSDRIGLKTFFDLLSFGEPYYTIQPYLSEIAIKARKDIYSLLELPNSWAGLGLFAVTGYKITSS